MEFGRDTQPVLLEKTNKKGKLWMNYILVYVGYVLHRGRLGLSAIFTFCVLSLYDVRRCRPLMSD